MKKPEISECYLRSLFFCLVFYLEEIGLFEAEHSGNHIGREHFNGVVVAHNGVVVSLPSKSDLVFGRSKLFLKSAVCVVKLTVYIYIIYLAVVSHCLKIGIEGIYPLIVYDGVLLVGSNVEICLQKDDSIGLELLDAVNRAIRERNAK